MSAQVWLNEAAVAELTVEADGRFPRETGGVLMGWHNDSGDTIVTCAVGPGRDATHDPYRFVPDGDWTDAEVARIYAESGRLITYLGDWHTHPRGVARPSPTDVQTLRKISSNPEARCREPIMVIAAGVANDWTIVCWSLRRRVLVRDSARRIPHRTWAS